MAVMKEELASVDHGGFEALESPGRNFEVMPEVGELIGGKYTLIRQLGRGGMGAVYEAVHEQIGKAVAVKVLLPQEVDQAELVARFLQEAQAAAAAGHRGIVDIYDVGVCNDGAPYLVMELLQGQSLAELLAAAGRLDISRTSYIVCQVLSALSAAHQARIVHRDLKPENIFLADAGAALPEVKLLDFGISRVIVPGSPGNITRMTKSGLVMGTPSYMSPEQAAGKKDIDHRTDLYSISVILFQCLTNDFPHSADNYNALMVSIISDLPINPRMACRSLPESLETIILKGLEKERDARYATAAQMFYELRPFVDSGAIASLRAPVSSDGNGVVVPTLREVSAEAISGDEPTIMASDTQPPTQPDLSSQDVTPTEAAPKIASDAVTNEGAPKPPMVPTIAIEAGENGEKSEKGPRRRGALTFVLSAVILGLVLGGGGAYYVIRQDRLQDEDSGDDSAATSGNRGGGAQRDKQTKAATLSPDSAFVATDASSEALGTDSGREADAQTSTEMIERAVDAGPGLETTSDGGGFNTRSPPIIPSKTKAPVIRPQPQPAAEGEMPSSGGYREVGGSSDGERGGYGSERP